MIFLTLSKRGGYITYTMEFSRGSDANMPTQKLIENCAGTYGLHRIKNLIDFYGDDPTHGGVDINYVCSNGWRPILIATLRYNKDIVQYLCEHGADVNASNNAGYTALHIAVSIHSESMVKILLDLGANPQLENENKKTATAIAYSYGNQEIINILENAQKYIKSANKC